MRQVLALTALFAVIASPALAMEDRYGPPRAQADSERRAVQIPQGSLLQWNGKAAAAAEPVEAEETQRPAPIAPWAQQLAAAQPTYQPRPAAEPRRAVAVRPPLPAQALPPQAQAAQALPVQPAPAQPQARLQSPAQTPVARTAAAPAAQAQGRDTAPRFYSVSRQFGGQPDPISARTAGRGEALTLAEPPMTASLGRSNAPLDDGRQAQAVIIPDTKQNAAANRVSRLGF